MHIGGLDLRLRPYGGAAAAPSVYDDAVSLWKLDEASGTRVDSIGSNDLTDNNTVLYQNMGPSGVVADFAAGTEFLSNADAGEFTAGQSRSWSFWWYDYDAGATNGGLLTRDDGSTREWAIQTGNTNLSFLVFDGAGTPTSLDSTTDFSEAFAKNKWHHAIVWFDSSDNTLHYRVDGGTARSKAGTGDIRGGSATFRVGPSQFYTASSKRVARVRAWTRVLTSDEQLAEYSAGAGRLYAALSASEKASLESAHDLSESSGNRADSHGSFTLTDNDTVGSVTNSYPANLPGTVASFVAANSESLTIDPGPAPTSLTISVWVKLSESAAGDQYGPIIKFKSGLGQVTFGKQDAGNTFLATNEYSSAWYETYTTKTWTANANYLGWSHVIAVIDDSANEMTLYLDGALWVGPVSYTNAWGTGVSGSVFQIGPSDNTYNLLGTTAGNNPLISSVALWDRVLTSDERAELYNSGDGAPLP